MKALIAILLYGYGKLAAGTAELSIRLAQRNHPVLKVLSWLIPSSWLSRITLRLARRQGVQLDWAEAFQQGPELIKSLSDEELEEVLRVLKDDEEYLKLTRKYPVLEWLGWLDRQVFIQSLENEKFLREHRRHYVASTVDPEGRES